MERMKVVSLFCGCGGMDLGVLGGFSYQGKKYAPNPFDIVYAVDNDTYCTQIYNDNFTHKCEVKDVKSIEIEKLPDFDILIGGFPCQSFSISAQNPPRLGYKDERGMLFFEMVKILKVKKPRFFIAENVKGILSANSGKAFPMIIKEFADAGYHVTYKLFNTSDYGIPQKRERVIIVGCKYKKDFEKFNFPRTTTKTKKVPLKSVVDYTANENEKWFFSDRAVAGMLLVKDKMNKGRAQNLEEPCNTISSHLAKVSLNSTDPVLKIGDRYRRFTPSECAAIQSFPTTFKFSSVSEARQYKAIGNAVPPVFMWHVAKALRNSIESVERLVLPCTDNEDWPPAPVQLSLFESQGLYLVRDNNSILIGSCRQGVRDWILNNMMYTYPISDKDLDEFPKLLKIKRLLIRYHKKNLGFFDVKNIRVVNHSILKEYDYPIKSSKHKASTEYLLFDLVFSEQPAPFLGVDDCRLILGKGVKI